MPSPSPVAKSQLPARNESPVFFVKLVAKNGNPVAGGVLAVDLSDFILSLVFEDKGRCADKLTLKVNNSDLRFFDDDTFRKNNILEVSWGYTLNLSRPRQIVITKVTGFQELKIEGHSRVMEMNRKRRARVFHNQTYTDIVKSVLGEYNYRDTQFIQNTDVVIPTVSQANMSDAEFLQNLANRNGFDFFIDYDGPHWHEPVYDQPAIASYTWYTGDVGEIYDIVIKNDILSAPAAVVTAGRDPKTKQTFFQAHTNQSVKRGGTGTTVNENVTPAADNYKPGESSSEQQAIPNVDSKEVIEVKIVSTPKSKDAAKQVGDGQFKRALEQTIKLTAKIIGNPRLVAKSVIEILGIGKRLSQRYYVQSIKHKVDGKNGYTCEVVCTSTGHNDPNSVKNNAKQNQEKRDTGATVAAEIPNPDSKQVIGFQGNERDLSGINKQ